MRRFALLWVATLAAPFSFGQAEPSETNLSCIAHLELPTYPAIAATANVHGRIIASIMVSKDGKAAAIDLSGDPVPARRLLDAFVQEAIAASTFRPDCQGRQVTVIFDFRIRPEVGPIKPIHGFSFPNIFFVETATPALQPEPTTLRR